MSEKALEVLTKLGITADFTAEDIDTDAVVTEFRTKQVELLKHDSEFITPIKDEVKKGAFAEAERKAKKVLNAKYGLGLSNKEIDETAYDDIVEKAYATTKDQATAEVTTLQEQIIALTNKAKEIEEAADLKVKTVEQEWASKYMEGRRSEIAAKEIGQLDLIIAKDKADKVAKVEFKENGWEIRFNEAGEPEMWKGDSRLLKADKTGFMSVTEAYASVLDDFVKKSNGAPGANGQPQKVTIPDNLHPAMAKRLQEMAEKFGA